MRIWINIRFENKLDILSYILLYVFFDFLKRNGFINQKNKM